MCQWPRSIVCLVFSWSREGPLQSLLLHPPPSKPPMEIIRKQWQQQTIVFLCAISQILVVLTTIVAFGGWHYSCLFITPGKSFPWCSSFYFPPPAPFLIVLKARLVVRLTRRWRRTDGIWVLDHCPDIQASWGWLVCTSAFQNSLAFSFVVLE